MDLQLKDGWIEVITGSMYAGKTEELLRRIKRIEYAKKGLLFLNRRLMIAIVVVKLFLTTTEGQNRLMLLSHQTYWII